MVISWITRTLNAQITQSTIYIDNAQDLWDDLRGRFSKWDYFRISGILQEVNFIRQGERSVSKYFIDLKVLWEELEFLRLILSCTCEVKCKCKVIKIVTDYRDSDNVICFLWSSVMFIQTLKLKYYLWNYCLTSIGLFLLYNKNDNSMEII